MPLAACAARGINPLARWRRGGRIVPGLEPQQWLYPSTTKIRVCGAAWTISLPSSSHAALSLGWITPSTSSDAERDGCGSVSTGRLREMPSTSDISAIGEPGDEAALPAPTLPALPCLLGVAPALADAPPAASGVCFALWPATT